MGRKGVAKIINEDNDRVYVISYNKDIHNYLEKVFTDLKNGGHKNQELQRDYSNNPHAFTHEIISTSCRNEFEVNEVRCNEIKKYWPYGYNKKCSTSHKGGNTNPFKKSGNNEDFVMTDFMERLFAILNKSNLPQEGKDFLEDIIDDGYVTSEYDLIRAIKDMERLLNILSKSNLKSKDKKKLKVKIMNGAIFSEEDLQTEIENILKTYKNKSKNKKTSNKNNSSKNKHKNKKPKKPTGEQYNKTHNTKPKKTFQDKLEREYTPMFETCPACSNPILKNDIYCSECGHKLKDKSYPSGNTNQIIAKLFMIEDNAGNLRYSLSKTLGFVILMLFIIADINVLLFGIPSTKLYNVTIITIGGLFYYALFRLAGIIYRKLSK